MQAPPEVSHAPSPPTHAPHKTPPRGEERKNQSATHNPWSSAHLKVYPGLGIRRAIYAVAKEGINVPNRDYNRHFCLSYHFKGVCNSNCGGRQSYRTMTQRNIGWMTEWKNRFFSEDAPPPVTVVETDRYEGRESVA